MIGKYCIIKRNLETLEPIIYNVYDTLNLAIDAAKRIGECDIYMMSKVLSCHVVDGKLFCD